MPSILPYHNEPPPARGTWEWERVLGCVALLKALSTLPPGVLLDVGPGFDWGWHCALELDVLRLVQFWQWQEKRRGRFRWVIQLTDLGRQLVAELDGK